MSRSAPASNRCLSSAGQCAVDPKNTHNKHKGKYHKSYLSVGCHKSIYFGGLSQVYAFENNMSSYSRIKLVYYTYSSVSGHRDDRSPRHSTRICWLQPAHGCQSVGGSQNAHVNKNITDYISVRAEARISRYVSPW